MRASLHSYYHGDPKKKVEERRLKEEAPPVTRQSVLVKQRGKETRPWTTPHLAHYTTIVADADKGILGR